MNILCVFWVDLLNYRLLIIYRLILVLSYFYMNILKYVLKVHEYFMCVLSLFAYLLNFRMLIICMNVIVCVIYAMNVGIYFLCWLLVLWQLVRRGTCHMHTGCGVPEVKTEKCMHTYHLDMYLYCMTCFIVLYLCNFIMHVGLKSSWELMLCCY
jgi:hypothetical protein